MSKYLISVVGPTAIGKTALSIKLAQHFNTEIISADSRQFFKEMQIGTAAPTLKELTAAKHHCIHHKSIKDKYNVGSFEKEALQILDAIFRKHDIAIMVGGSGLYVNAVIKGLDDFPEVHPDIRTHLNTRLIKEGLEVLQLELQQLDPEGYNNIAIDNPHRVLRALEICIGSGQPYSSFLGQSKNKRPFEVISIGLTADRQIIYDRINQRVDAMVNNGLIEEVKSLTSYKHLNALNTVGYKEIFNYFDNIWTLEFAISEIKKNSRRFAKRQLTWFKKDTATLWFDNESKLDTIIKTIHTKMEV